MADISSRKRIYSNSRERVFLRGVPVGVRDDCPSGKIYFINQDWGKNRDATITSIEDRKWRAKIYDTLRAYARRLKRNKGQD